MSVRMIEQLAPRAFQAAAEDLGLAGEPMIDAKTLFVEQAKAVMARVLPKLAKILRSALHACRTRSARCVLRDTAWQKDADGRAEDFE